MERRLQSLKGSHHIIRLDHVFYAFSGDMIGEICCESPPNFINHPDFAPHLYETFITWNEYTDSDIDTTYLTN